MKTLKKIGIKSCARFYAATMAVLYGIGGAIMVLMGLGVFLLGGGYYMLGGGVAVLIFGALFGWVIGYLMGALCAWIYNMIAERIGGIQVELE